MLVLDTTQQRKEISQLHSFLDDARASLTVLKASTEVLEQTQDMVDVLGGIDVIQDRLKKAGLKEQAVN